MNNELENLRQQIDFLDEQLLEILAKRMAIVKEVGIYKKTNGIPPLDKNRWKEVLRRKIIKANILNLSTSFVLEIYDVIHEQALEIEKNI